MLIVCPACVSTYRIDPAVIGEVPNAFRCAHCRRAWDVTPALAITGPLQPVDARVGRPDQTEVRLPAPPFERAVRPRPTPAQRQPRSRPGQPVERSAAATLLMVAAGVGLGMGCVAWRETVARVIPAAAPVFAAIGLPTEPVALSLSGIRSALGEEGLAKTLTVDGEIRNLNKQAMPIPDLRLVVRDRDEQSLYSWIAPPPKAAIGPGETIAFQSRITAPPETGSDLLVTFADARGGARLVRVKDKQ